MQIIIGLGNTGEKYSNHRHNMGFHVLDALAEKKGLLFEESKIWQADIVKDGELMLVKPRTFMNLSGKSAALLVREYNSPIVVVYDDIDIPLGSVKCSFSRGAGGHNGVQSVIDHIGHKDFFRIRVGIRPIHDELLPRIAPPNGFETFMLSDFAPFEEDVKAFGIAKAIAIISDLQNYTYEEIMNRYNEQKKE